MWVVRVHNMSAFLYGLMDTVKDSSIGVGRVILNNLMSLFMEIRVMILSRWDIFDSLTQCVYTGANRQAGIVQQRTVIGRKIRNKPQCTCIEECVETNPSRAFQVCAINAVDKQHHLNCLVLLYCMMAGTLALVLVYCARAGTLVLVGFTGFAQLEN